MADQTIPADEVRKIIAFYRDGASDRGGMILDALRALLPGGRPVTPDKARALLDGTTPGPWIPSKSGYIGSAAGVMIHDGHVLGDTDADTCLIAAAPTLAAMIAGMTTEYRHEVQSIVDGTWHPLTEWAEGEPDRRPWNVTPTRIVRRYVTEPEEA